MTRAEKVAKAQELRAQGHKQREIATCMGVATSTVHGWLTDPDRSKELARKASYGGKCVDCGTRTDGTDGRANAPVRCAACATRYRHESRYWTPERIVGSIKKWVQLFGDTPSATDWNVSAQHHDAERWASGHWPGVSTVQCEFGSWANAIRAAGFEPKRKSGFGAGKTPRELVDRTVALWHEHHDLSKVAEILGDITNQGVRYRLEGPGGLSLGQLAPDYAADRDKARRLHSQGRTVAQISQDLDVAKTTIYRWLRQENGPMPSYNAQEAIRRDIEKVEDRIKVLHHEIEEREQYLVALKAAASAMETAMHVNGAEASVAA